MIHEHRAADGEGDESFDAPLAGEGGATGVIIPREGGIGPPSRRRRERFEYEWREQLAAAKGGIDPLAGERVEEIGGVAGERGAGCPRPPRPLREGAGDAG